MSETLFPNDFTDDDRVDAGDADDADDARRLVICPTRCRARCCVVCGRRDGWVARQRLYALVEAGRFSAPGLLTLTVDRSRFASPEEAHKYVNAEKCVARLMRLFGVKWWVWVLEFQTKTGDGWPHWHVLIDKSALPGRFFSLKRAWKFWREKWGVGGLQLAGDRKGMTAKHAVNYITKYMLKQPEGGYPVWVLESSHMRFIGSSKAVGVLTTHPKDASPPPDDDPDPRGPASPLIDRMAACGESSVLFAERADPDTGEVRYQHVGRVPMSPADLAAHSAAGVLPVKVVAEEVEVTRESGTFKRTRYYTSSTFSGLWAALLDTYTDLPRRQRERVAENRRRLLEGNAFARRREAAAREGVSDTPASGGTPLSQVTVQCTPQRHGGGECLPARRVAPPPPAVSADQPLHPGRDHEMEHSSAIKPCRRSVGVAVVAHGRCPSPGRVKGGAAAERSEGTLDAAGGGA